MYHHSKIFKEQLRKIVILSFFELELHTNLDTNYLIRIYHYLQFFVSNIFMCFFCFIFL